MERERLNQLRHLVIESKHIHDKLISRTPAIRTYGDTTGDYRTGRKRIIITRGDTDPVEDRYIRRMTEKKKTDRHRDLSHGGMAGEHRVQQEPQCPEVIFSGRNDAVRDR